MTYNEVQKLCEKWRDCPGIVRGIMEAWRADRSVPASEKGMVEDWQQMFDEIFGKGRKC